uniref:Anoctamin n=1 Tax=Loa loa TaxID=7209 RepID=A0A1I7VYK4_LOALO
MNFYYGGAHPSQNVAYRNYLQLNTSPTLYRRSRTVPTRAILPKICKMMYTKQNRGYAVDPYFLYPLEYRSHFGSWEDARRWPMYRKKKRFFGRIQTYQESEFGGNPIDRQPHYCHGLYRVQLDMQPTALRRIRPYYTPSYVTYPPCIMNTVRTKTKYSERYSIIMKTTVKAIELVGNFFDNLLLGVAAIGFIIAPMREMSLYAFVKIIQTEWQVLVLGSYNGSSE